MIAINDKRRDGACPVFICLTRVVQPQFLTLVLRTRVVGGLGRSALNNPHFGQMLYNLQQKRHQIALMPFLILDY